MTANLTAKRGLAGIHSEIARRRAEVQRQQAEREAAQRRMEAMLRDPANEAAIRWLLSYAHQAMAAEAEARRAKVQV